MSVLKLKCVDQVITIMTTPLIASGVKEVIELQVDFNNAWDSFGKTAVFYRDDTKVYHVVMVDNKCIIPHEVLETDGVMYLGVFGVHGNQRLTSNVLRYKIVKGAILEGEEPKSPTPEIYEQILNVYGQILTKYETIFKDIDKIVADAVLQGVVNQNRPDELCKFWFGTKAEYDTLPTKENNVIYYVTDDDTSISFNVDSSVSDGKFVTLTNVEGTKLYPKTKLGNIVTDSGNAWEPSTLKIKTDSMTFKNGTAKQENNIDNILCLRKLGDSPSPQITTNIYGFSTIYTDDSNTTTFEVKITDQDYANYNGTLLVIYLAT